MTGSNTTFLVLLVASGAAVPLGMAGYDVVQADAEALAAEAEETVDRALHDLSRLPLVVDQAHGHTADGGVAGVSLLVRATGPVDLGGVVLTEDGRVLDWRVTEVLRDRDGGATDGLLDRGDLVRVRVDLPSPWAAGSEASLALHGDAPAESLRLSVPHNTHPELVELRVL